MADEVEAVVEPESGLESQEPAEGQEPAGPPPTYLDLDQYGDHLVRMKFGDEVVEVPAREAFLEGLRQQDYTRKTQVVAREREELSQAAKLIQALEDNPRVTIAALQSAYADELDLGGYVEDPEELDPETAWQQRVDGFIAEQEERQQMAELQANLGRLHGAHGEFSDIELVQFAAENGIYDLNKAYAAWSWERLQEYEAIRKQQDQALQDHKAGMPPVASGHGVQSGSVTTGGAEPVKDIRGALKQAMAQHGVSSLDDVY